MSGVGVIGVKNGSNLVIPYSASSIQRSGTILATSEDVSAWPQVTSDGTTIYVKDGYALANGASLSQAAYAELFAKIGSGWNTAVNPLTGSAQAAPSSGFFRLPNLMGTFLRGVGDFTDNSKDTALAGFQGDKTKPNGLNIPSSGSHEHSYISSASNGKMCIVAGGDSGWGSINFPNGGNVSNDAWRIRAESGGSDHTHSLAGDSETRPQNVGVYYIIKLFDNVAKADVYVPPELIIPTGMVAPFAGSAAPTGWLMCDGSDVSPTTYPNLFTVIGHTYKNQIDPTTGTPWGNPTGFRVPDYRGSFLRGVGTPSGLDAVSLGGHQAQKTAKNGLSVSVADGGGHAHIIVVDDGKFLTTTRIGQEVPGPAHGVPNSVFAQDGPSTSVWTAGAVGDHSHAPSISSGDNETRPMNKGVNYIIKY